MFDLLELRFFDSLSAVGVLGDPLPKLGGVLVDIKSSFVETGDTIGSGFRGSTMQCNLNLSISATGSGSRRLRSFREVRLGARQASRHRLRLAGVVLVRSPPVLRALEWDSANSTEAAGLNPVMAARPKGDGWCLAYD
jgi:hypothetical protein